ncbi:MAG: HPr family phosphocarrier protein [Pseudomonadota bacterium]
MTPEPPKTLKATVEIVNAKGLHARASAKFATLAEHFDAKVTVSRDGMSVAAYSIMGLLMLAAAKGCEIEIAASGRDAEAALAGLVDLVRTRFGEAE